MNAIVVKGSFLMTEDGLEENWGLRVEGNRIVQVGPNETLTVNEGDQVVDAKDQMILPGFVNGHNHMYNVVARGITTDAIVTEFSSFLEDFWWPYVENRINHEMAEITTKRSCVEMIESGITSFVDILEAPNAIPGGLEVERKVIEEAGLRAKLSFEACQRMSEENGQTGLKENADFIRNHKGEMVDAILSTHTLFSCSEDFVKQAKAMANEVGGLMHMHLSESVFEPTWCKEHGYKTPVETYEDWGVLDENTVASQVVQASDMELDILAKHGVKVVHMPLSNCEVGGGVAPVRKMLERGITVGLGTDGFNNSFFEVMRGAWMIHKAYEQDPQVMPADVVFKMATSMGAKAVGFDEVGSLEVGKLADVIVLDTDTSTPINKHNVYDQIVLYRNPCDVKHVMCDGKWLKWDGKLTTLDKDAVRKECSEKTGKFWKVNG